MEKLPAGGTASQHHDILKKLTVLTTQTSRQDGKKLKNLGTLIEDLAPTVYQGDMFGAPERQLRVLQREKIPLIKKEIDRLLSEDFRD